MRKYRSLFVRVGIESAFHHAIQKRGEGNTLRFPKVECQLTGNGIGFIDKYVIFPVEDKINAHHAL